MPSIFASASVTSSCLPGSTSALSMTSVSTCLFPERRMTFAPQGRTGCVTPSDWGARTWPQVVRWASPVAPREPAKAMFQPAGAGALVRAAAPALLPFCATIAIAATAARSATAASMARRWARAGGTAQVWLTARLRGVLVDQPDAELAQLLRACESRSARQGVGAARHLRERDDLADVRLVCHEREEPLDPHREPAVRRSAHRERVEEESELRARLVIGHAHRSEDVLLDVRAVDPDRPRPELPAVPDEIVVLAQSVSRIAGDSFLVAGDRRGERMMEERPVARVVVDLEQREIDDPVEQLLVRRELELATEVNPHATEHARDRRRVAGAEQHGRAPLRAEGVELRLRQELRDRRADLAALVDEVREALRAPLLRDLLESLQLGPREDAGNRQEADRLGAAEDAELGAARHLGRILDLETEAQIRLVRAVAQKRIRERQPRERPCGGVAPDGRERIHDDLLEHVEHVLPLDERHFEIELAELELAVRPEILVSPARGDLVVAIEPADHAELLEDLRRLREREEPPRLEPHRHEEVAGALRRPSGHARRPHVDEPEAVHRPPDRGDHRVRQPHVPLHARGAEVEPA